MANAAAKQWMLEAQAGYRTNRWTDFKIISEVPDHSGSREQEFITETLVPEPRLLNLFCALFAIALALLKRGKA